MFELVCPQCERTYDDDATTCPRCDGPLVVRFGGAAVGHGERGTATDGERGRPEPDDDRVVELTRLATMPAEFVATRLRAEGIPAALFACGFATWLSNEFRSARRVMVLERDRARAQVVLDDLFSSDALGQPVDDADLAAQADAATGFSDPETGAVV